MSDRVMAPTSWEWPVLGGGVLAGIALLVALFPPESLGSEYFTFLRWLVFVVSGFWIAYGARFPRTANLIVGLIAGVIWNPLLPIYLDRSVWIWLDLSFGLLFLLFSNRLVPTREKGAEDTRQNWK